MGEETTSDRRKYVRWAGIATAIAAAALIEPLLHRGTLIDRIDLRWTLLAGTLGALLGFGYALLLEKAVGKNSIRQAVALCLLVLGGAALATYYVRGFIELGAFQSYSPRTEQISATVVSKDAGRWATFARLLPEPGARELQARISDELYDQLEPYRHPGRDCIKLRVEIGRGGIRRTTLPNPLDEPLSLNRLTACKSQA